MELEPILARFQGFEPLFDSLVLDPDPDSHQGDKSNPDLHQNDADPQHWFRRLLPYRDALSYAFSFSSKDFLLLHFSQYSGSMTL
jgi:hypothetical protein